MRLEYRRMIEAAAQQGSIDPAHPPGWPFPWPYVPGMIWSKVHSLVPDHRLPPGPGQKSRRHVPPVLPILTLHKSWYCYDDACDICQQNADDGEIPIWASFSGGVVSTPQHGKCRCWVYVNFGVHIFVLKPPPCEKEQDKKGEADSGKKGEA